MSGQGSVFKLPNGHWRAQLSLGSRTDRRFVTRTRRTRGEALAALADLRTAHELRRDPSRLSLGAYLRRWLDESARPTLSPNTYRGYEDAIAHLAPIADVALERLTAEDIEAACNRMVNLRGTAGAPAAPKTVRNVQVMLRRALGQAEARGHVRRNVAKLVPLRRVPRVSHEPLTPAMARAILAAVAGDRYEAAYALGFVGLRQGEVLGLAWDDVQLAGPSPVADIRYQSAGSGPAARRAPLKTDASAATVPLPPFVVSRLLAHQERQRLERPVIGLDGGLVFVTPRGYAVSGSWLTKHFQGLLAAAGLPRMRLHDLRHGAASLLVAAGAHPRVAQELLRHASSRTTLEVYSHVSAGQQREAVEMLERSVTESVTPNGSRVAGSRPE